jgi:hypothetical protein
MDCDCERDRATVFWVKNQNPSRKKEGGNPGSNIVLSESSDSVHRCHDIGHAGIGNPSSPVAKNVRMSINLGHRSTFTRRAFQA